MGVVVIVGTDKGGMLIRADDAREHWELGELAFRGWRGVPGHRGQGTPPQCIFHVSGSMR